jgi:hypothetical protein
MFTFKNKGGRNHCQSLKSNLVSQMHMSKEHTNIFQRQMYNGVGKSTCYIDRQQNLTAKARLKRKEKLSMTELLAFDHQPQYIMPSV